MVRAPFCALGAAVLVNLALQAEARKRPVTRAEIVPSQESLKLAFPGVKGPIPYESFGQWEGIGTARYRYVMKDRAGLARAAGEGIYPNSDIYKDPTYQKLQREGRLNGNQWRFADTPNSALGFYRWATAAEDPGVKQFYVSLMFERLGYIAEAVKSFYAIAVHFPKTVSFSYFDTPWYVGPAALDRMEQLLRRHPQLKMRWFPGEIKIQGKFGTRVSSGPFRVDPGRLVADSKGDRWETINLKTIPVIKTVGGSKVQLKEYANHHWQFFVDGKPFIIKGLTYSLTPIGLSPDRGTWNPSKDWQFVDTNHNGLHDGFFESYIDRNGNGRRDPDEPVVGDAELIKELGVNTLRAYHHIYNKELFRRLYKEYGLYVLCGDIMGGYAVDSGATWYHGTDYRDVAQQERMLSNVRKMVEETKDEPYVLMWVLGNENIYGVGNNSPQFPEAFYELVDRAAQLIHELDPSRPVALANGDLLHLDLIREKCPHIDVMGANVYRSEQGLGRSLFQDVQDQLGKPMLITEFGAPAIAEGYTQEQAEAYQAMYLANNWEDLEAHTAGRGVGNAIGGVLFEYIDEWWKANSDLPLKVQKERADWYAPRSAIYKNLQPDTHDTVPQFGGPYLDGWSYEEWLGITSFGSGKDSPFARTLRPAYFTMKHLFNSD
jgi:beta-glucuronidase